MRKTKTVKTRSRRKRTDQRRARFRRHRARYSTKHTKSRHSHGLGNIARERAERKLSLKNEIHHLGLLGVRVDLNEVGLNEDCFLVFFQYFPEFSVFLRKM